MVYRLYSNKLKKNFYRINVIRKYIRELLILDFVDYVYVYKKKNLYLYNYWVKGYIDI